VAYYDVVSALSPDYWWKLDGDETDSADAADSDGGVDPSWVDSIILSIAATNDCGDYNGTSSETDIPNQDDINGGTTYQKSISVWIVADTIDTTDGGRVIWGEGGSSNGFAIYVYDDSLYVCVYESASIDYISYPISTGTLYHIGVTLDCNAEALRLYLNGTEVASKTGGLNINGEFSAHSAGVAIGGVDSTLNNHLDGNLDGFFDGRIADVAYWAEQAVLDTDDFNAIYEAGAVTVEYEQEGFRWRDDDADEDEATWLANQDTDISRGKNLNTRLRILTDTAGDSPSAGATLQYCKVGDPDTEWETIA
jgi:hypothetical protein